MIALLVLCTHHLLDHISGHGVEEKGQNNSKEGDNNGFDDDPFVVPPEDISNRLERAQKPYERAVRTARVKQKQVISFLQFSHSKPMHNSDMSVGLTQLCI